jgi:hypothetical protein
MGANKETFLTISVLLTGFDEMELLGTGMLDTYFNVAMNRNSHKDVTSFFAAVDKILAGNKDEINDQISLELMPQAYFAGMTQNIITMWYMGSWMNDIINPASYTQGLIWKAADTHPPGAKQPGFGSWETAPLTVK